VAYMVKYVVWWVKCAYQLRNPYECYQSHVHALMTFIA